LNLTKINHGRGAYRLISAIEKKFKEHTASFTRKLPAGTDRVEQAACAPAHQRRLAYPARELT